MIEWRDGVTESPVSVKIENRSNSPSFSHAAGDSNHVSSCQANKNLSYSSLAKSQPRSQTPHKTSSKTSTCRPDDACCPHGAAAIKAGKFQCTSPRLVGAKRRRSRSRSTTPPTSHPVRSRSHHSRVDIKTECTTPTLHKKSSRYHHYLLIHCCACLLAVD